MSIFDHTDDDGDRIRINRSDDGTGWIVGAGRDSILDAQVILDQAAIRRLAGAAFAHASDWEPARILPVVDAEISYPEDERRLAALNEAAELLGDKYRSPDNLIKVADWIVIGGQDE